MTRYIQTAATTKEDAVRKFLADGRCTPCAKQSFSGIQVNTPQGSSEVLDWAEFDRIAGELHGN